MSLLTFQINCAFLEPYYTKSANLMIKEGIKDKTFPILVTFNQNASISFHFFPPEKEKNEEEEKIDDIETAFVIVYLYCKTGSIFKTKKSYGWGIFSPSHPIVVTFQMKSFVKLQIVNENKILTYKLKLKQYDNKLEFLFPDDDLVSAISEDTDSSKSSEANRNVFWISFIKTFGILYLKSEENIFNEDIEKCYRNYFSNSNISTLNDFFFYFALKADEQFSMDKFFTNSTISNTDTKNLIKTMFNKRVKLRKVNDKDNKLEIIRQNNETIKDKDFVFLNKSEKDFSNIEVLVDKSIYSKKSKKTFNNAHVISMKKNDTETIDLSFQSMPKSSELYSLIKDNYKKIKKSNIDESKDAVIKEEVDDDATVINSNANKKESVNTNDNIIEEEEEVNDDDDNGNKKEKKSKIQIYKELVIFDSPIQEKQSTISNSEVDKERNKYEIVLSEKSNNLFAFVQDKIPAINFNAFPFQFDLEKTLFVSFESKLSPTIEIKENPSKEMILTMYDFTEREEISFILEEQKNRFIIFNALFKDMPTNLFYKIKLGENQITNISNIFIFWKFERTPADLIYLNELPTFKFNVNPVSDTSFRLISKRLYYFYIPDGDYEISIEIATATNINSSEKILH